MPQRGFTLVEVIIYVLIVGLVLGTIGMFLVNLLQARAATQASSHVITAARVIQDRLALAMRHASAVNVGASTFGVDPGVLSLDMVDAALDPTIFSLTTDDGQMQVQQGANPAVSLTVQEVAVTNLTFTNLTSSDDIGIIRAQFTLETDSDSGSAFYQYEQTFETTLRIPLDD